MQDHSAQREAFYTLFDTPIGFCGIVAAGGKLGGFSANGGGMTKRRLLAIEGARRDESPTLFDLIP